MKRRPDCRGSRLARSKFLSTSAETGELEWKQTIPGGWVWGSAAYDDGMVYVPTVNGYCVCLDAKNGHIVWMYPTAKSVPAEPAIDGDLVYFGSERIAVCLRQEDRRDRLRKTASVSILER